MKSEKYIDFICRFLQEKEVGSPIYTSQLAKRLADTYDLTYEKARAVAVDTVTEIVDRKILIDLRVYQSNIYYRTAETPFGEIGINKGKLIADKYLQPDKG